MIEDEGRRQNCAVNALEPLGCTFVTPANWSSRKDHALSPCLAPGRPMDIMHTLE